MIKQELNVELLYFAGCPSYRQAWNDILDVLVEKRLDASVRLVAVEDPGRAQELRFAGSPSVRVNGRDLENVAGAGAMACRVYNENGGKGWPSQALLRRRIEEAQEQPEQQEQPAGPE